MKIFCMLKYPFAGGFFLPFKVYSKAGIRISAGAVLKLDGRVTIGQKDPAAAVVSRLPVNLFIGKNAEAIFGHSVTVGPGVNIILKNGSRFRVGESTYFTSDIHLEVVNSIAIGSSCAISWGVTIIDDDHHRILGGKETGKVSEVVIGDRVWIGCNTTILKGTRIGNNCVVAAGSVVKGVFPDRCLIAGNPARVIRENVDWE